MNSMYPFMQGYYYNGQEGLGHHDTNESKEFEFLVEIDEKDKDSKSSARFNYDKEN